MHVFHPLGSGFIGIPLFNIEVFCYLFDDSHKESLTGGSKLILLEKTALFVKGNGFGYCALFNH
jgi:hypothetical protein